MKVKDLIDELQKCPLLADVHLVVESDEGGAITQDLTAVAWGPLAIDLLGPDLNARPTTKKRMNAATKFAVFCKMTCLGGSEKGTCECTHPADCAIRFDDGYEDAIAEACKRIG